MSEWEYTETELWRHGGEKSSLMHVFGVVAMENVVLAFAEARDGKGGDVGCIHEIWMRRSEDSGRTFAENVVICAGEGVHCWTNPVPVYDAQAKRLFLFYADNHDNRSTENFVVFSDDAGVTWSGPRRLNAALEAGADPLPFHLEGPGHGIQLKKGAHAGRLIVPFWHRRYGVEKPARERGYCASILYSDDHGETWRHTEPIGQACMANESRVAETENGLVWVMRAGGNNPCRFESRSVDGGENWSEPVPQAAGPANNCDAGVTAVRGKAPYDDMLLVSRVSWIEQRRDMEILISLDGGRTFPDVMKLAPGDAMPGYSDLCTLAEDEPVIGLVHCRSNHVLFSRISLQALTNGKYENTKRNCWLS